MLYTDHGSDFTRRHLEQVAADLHLRLVFFTAGVPQGRGKVERFCATTNVARRVDVEDRAELCGAALEMEGPAGGWWSSAAALQGEAANHRKVLRSRAVVLSVAEKARRERVR